MFKRTTLYAKRIGISHPTIDSLLQNMHWKALRRLEQMIRTRRRLEHEGSRLEGIQRRPLANKRNHITRVGLGELVCILGPTFSPDA